MIYKKKPEDKGRRRRANEEHTTNLAAEFYILSMLHRLGSAVRERSFGSTHRQKLDPDPARTTTITLQYGKITELWGEILGHEKTMIV